MPGAGGSAHHAEYDRSRHKLAKSAGYHMARALAWADITPSLPTPAHGTLHMRDDPAHTAILGRMKVAGVVSSYPLEAEGRLRVYRHQT